MSHPPDTRSARPGQPRRPPPASRLTRTSLPRNSDAGLASASPLSIVRCLRAASSSWTPLCPLSATGLPGAALSCSYLASLRACLPGAPAPSEPRRTLHVVEAAQPLPPPCGGPRSCADPRGVASGCCYRLRVLMSPRAHRAGTPAPSEPRWTLLAVEVDRPPLSAPGQCVAAPRRHPWSLRANASPGQLACLLRSLSAQPQL